MYLFLKFGFDCLPDVSTLLIFGVIFSDVVLLILLSLYKLLFVAITIPNILNNREL